VATRIEIARLKEAMPDSTMIYVTHDQVEAMTLASRIVVLANKGIAQVGTPLELYETPDNEFVAQFIGSPSMNLLPGQITETGQMTTVALESGGVAVSTVPTEASDQGKHVNIGVRPEHLVMTEDSSILSGVVDFTEALGEVTLLYFDKTKGAESVIAKLPGVQKDLRGKTVSVTAAPEKVHLFHDGMSMRK
jgi:alpha-glucoside transport system ATP-binding protein